MTVRTWISKRGSRGEPSSARPSTALSGLRALDIDLGTDSSRMMDETTIAANPGVSHFLGLPGELRNTIYDLIIERRSVNTIIVTIPNGKTPATLRLSPLHPSLAKTCRQVRNEVLSIFYGDQIFTIEPIHISRSGAYPAPPWIPSAILTIQPSLSYLRSIKFHLLDEYGNTKVEVHASISAEGRLECPDNEYYEEICYCRFQRCARDVERGVIGWREDPMLVRFVRAWDLELPGGRTGRYSHCGFCGKDNAYLSLWKPDWDERGESDGGSRDSGGYGVP